ncbi:MAG TPA: hypothetical protein VE616_01605 [Candidatus Udaeobacter sp.]|jgi:hypothetical protein|nr:hypothetical protein [Candidatus Udaeobacter sp.]
MIIVSQRGAGGCAGAGSIGGSGRGWKVSQLRALVGYVLIRRLGYKVKDVARGLRRDMATVNSLVLRFADRMSEN